jgi:hypothetical protein
MKNNFQVLICLIFITISNPICAQKTIASDRLFSDQTVLKINLNYSNEKLNRKTNDSTYIQSKLLFFEKNQPKEINISLRARGNFRRKNCFFTPVKMKIKKSESPETIFEGNRSLKLVLPCIDERDKNDNIIKEFIAYKIYEIISPYYFQTRRLQITLVDQNEKSGKKYNLKGFLIEDDDKVAERFDGKIVKRKINPLAMDNFNSLSLSFFNFMIGNSDFSSSHHHNGKLLFSEKKIFPIPYDFDLTGWVNPSYGKGVINRLGYSVEKRNFMGFNRGNELFFSVRDYFLEKKETIFDKAASFEMEFDQNYEFNTMMDYLKDFYRILESDKLFKRLIVSRAK